MTPNQPHAALKRDLQTRVTSGLWGLVDTCRTSGCLGLMILKHCGLELCSEITNVNHICIYLTPVICKVSGNADYMDS